MTFGEKIKKARKEKGLTQKQLASLINVKHNSISNWENNQNKPDPDTIELLCGALSMTPSYLLGWDEGVNKNNKSNSIYQKKSDISKNEDMRNIALNESCADYNADVEIYDLAAHGVGYNGKLTDQQREDVKFAIQIALARHKKDK